MSEEIRFVLKLRTEYVFGGNVWVLTCHDGDTAVDEWTESDLTDEQAIEWADLLVFRQLNVHPDACPEFLRDSPARRWAATATT